MEQKSPLNTILLFVTIGVLGFIAHSSYDSSVSIAVIQSSQITRPELETKLTEINAKIASINVQVTAINLWIDNQHNKK